MTELNIEALGEAIARHLQHDNDLWSSDRCASYLDIKGGAKSFLLYYAPLPSFPEPIEIPSVRSTKRNTLRWKPSEVRAWAESKQRKNTDKSRNSEG